MRRTLVILACLPLLAAALATGQTYEEEACHGWKVCGFPKTCGEWDTNPCGAPFCQQDADGNWYLFQRTEMIRGCWNPNGVVCVEYMPGSELQNTGIACNPS
jgi:hypothetical protein